MAALDGDRFAEALEALRRPLRFAAQDGFAHLDRVVDLGGTLAAAAARLLPFVDGARRQALEAWGRELAGWQGAPRGTRESLVARGLRLSATVALEAPPPPPPPPPAPRVDPARMPRAGSPLDAPLIGLPGVGPRTAEKLAARGLRTRGDLLHFLPRRWDDLRAVTPLGELVEGPPQTTRAAVRSARVVFGRKRFLEVQFVDPAGGAARLVARWFYFRGGMKERFVPGARFALSGTFRRYQGVMQVAHPEVMPLEGDEDEEAGGALRVRYPEVEGVPGAVVARLCRKVAEQDAGRVIDGLP